MLKEYDNIKDKIKNLKTWTAHRRFYSIYKIMLLKCFLKEESIESM